MEVDRTTTEFTIVRLKRKRNAEPLDALVVKQLIENGIEHKKKRPKQQTDDKGKENVSDESKDHEKESVPLIFRFAETVDEISFSDSNKKQQLKDRIVKLINRKDPVRRKEHEVKKFRDQQIAMFKESARKERYKVIDRNRQKSGASLFSSDENEDGEEVSNELFKMYDAVREEEASSRKTLNIINDQDSDIMCNFIPMIREYLTLEENADKEDHVESDDEYVYDVYYRDDFMSFDDTNDYHNIAALTWFEEDNHIFMKEATKDEFEYSDEEDSNAEDYYTHDYPDEEEVWSEQEAYSSEDDY
ncbi:5792_t:CDS:10 [Acaulospora morrowiae]|uniref:Probable RNA polymerase II nuclear localization protein SLC7A6OS n=1 Tax=Acaulospora morrowiae TaxID=94023 RepID=A0A9N9BY75_9GLOM|nr:5792_t:CDS:10 [Acaulospora morrowiae]